MSREPRLAFLKRLGLALLACPFGLGWVFFGVQLFGLDYYLAQINIRLQVLVVGFIVLFAAVFSGFGAMLYLSPLYLVIERILVKSKSDAI